MFFKKCQKKEEMEEQKIKAPEYASWESTLLCDLKCKHCGLSAGRPRANELGFKESTSLIAELADFGVKNIVISGGEFTLRHNWLLLLQHALYRFESVRVISNGRLGAGFIQILEKLCDVEKLTISLSLDGIGSVHDQRRGERIV